MKIMIVTPYFYPKIGGLENYVKNLVNWLKTNGDDVLVVTSSDNDHVEYIEGIKIYRLKKSLTISNTPLSFSWFFKIRKILKNEKPDIVNAHMPVPGLSDIACILTNVPLIVTYHAGRMRKDNQILDILLYFYERFILQNYIFNKARAIVVPSSFVIKNMKINPRKAIVIPPCVTGGMIKIKNKKHKVIKVISVGGLKKSEKHKGIEYIIRAFPKIIDSYPMARLLLVGNGDANRIKELDNTAKILKVEKYVDFVGEKSSPYLDKIFGSSDVLVVPSLNESFGMVIIEGMSMGIPVVASNIGGIPEIISNGVNGILVPPGEPEYLSKAVIEIMDDKQLRNKFILNGRDLVKEKFSLEKLGCSNYKIFEKVLYGA